MTPLLLTAAAALLAAGAATALYAPRAARRWLAAPVPYQPHTAWLASLEDRK